jgi:hypothetical protein
MVLKRRNKTQNKTIKRKQNKTMKKQKNGNDTILFIKNTMNYLATIKMYHWTTDSYAAHKATDKFYSKLQDFMDSYVETSLGHHQNKKQLINKIHTIRVKNITSNSQLHTYTMEYKRELKNIRNKLPDNKKSEMINVLDDILTEIDVLLYLLTLE